MKAGGTAKNTRIVDNANDLDVQYEAAPAIGAGMHIKGVTHLLIVLIDQVLIDHDLIVGQKRRELTIHRRLKGWRGNYRKALWIDRLQVKGLRYRSC